MGFVADWRRLLPARHAAELAAFWAPSKVHM